MWAESIVPEGEPGGGAWSYIQLTLRALWDEYTKYRSWWTKGNEGLPLVRYRYTKLTFYRSKWTDYIVIIKLCPPFSVTREDYLDTQPGRMLMNIKKIVVPHLGRKQYKKTYITKKIHPPSLWLNKWYFQQDVCNLPLLVLKTCATSLDQYYQPDTQLSNNITIVTINTDMYQNVQWHYDEGTEGYVPKQVMSSGQLKKVYIYGNERGGNETPTNWKQLTALWNTKTYTPGTNIGENNKKENWGNPFHPKWLSPDVTLWYSFQKPTETLTSISQFYYTMEKCRYNPIKDTGIGNTIYFKSTKLNQGTVDTLPENKDIIITEYPIWLVMWAWTDWIQKLKPIQHITEDYQIIIKSNFITPKRKTYLFIDKYMWGRDETHANTELTETDKVNWHPKYGYQTEIENLFAETGPAAPKINHSKSIEAYMKYNVKVKWGGCPAPMENISNPCEQERFPTPSNVNCRYEITNPSQEKETFLYRWDERDSFITATAAKRLKTDHSTKKSLTDFPSLNPPVQEKETETQETSSEEEEQTPILKQLNRINKRKQLLRDRIRRLIKSKL